MATDDNSIFSNGYIYLNGEATLNNYLPNSWEINTATVSEPSAKLIKIKYNDFTDINKFTSGYTFTNYNSLFRGNRNLENAMSESHSLRYFK